MSQIWEIKLTETDTALIRFLQTHQVGDTTHLADAAARIAALNARITELETALSDRGRVHLVGTLEALR